MHCHIDMNRLDSAFHYNCDMLLLIYKASVGATLRGIQVRTTQIATECDTKGERYLLYFNI